MSDCASCEEGLSGLSCMESKRKCGHHCNHSWSHDSCCWCGEEFGPECDESVADKRGADE